MWTFVVNIVRRPTHPYLFSFSYPLARKLGSRSTLLGIRNPLMKYLDPYAATS